MLGRKRPFRLCVALGRVAPPPERSAQTLRVPAREEVEQTRLDLVAAELEQAADHLVLVRVLGDRLEQHLLRLGVAAGGALDHVRPGEVAGRLP